VSTAAYVVSLLLPEIIRDLHLKENGLEILPRSPSSFTPLPDDRYLLMGPEPGLNEQQIAKFSQRDAEAFPRYEALLERVARVLEPVLAQSAPDPLPLPTEYRKIGLGKKMRDARKMWSLYQAMSRLGGDMPEAIELLTGAARPILDRWFECEPLKATLATDAIIGAFAAPSTPGSAYVLLHHVMGEAGGARGVWGYVRGGMGQLAAAIATTCQHAGVVIRREAEVARILTEKGRAVGVALADGTELAAGVVASSVDAHLTFERFLEPEVLPEEFRQAVGRVDYASASAKINVALSEPPQFTALPASEIGAHHHGTMHISPTVDYIERGYDQAKYGQPSREPILEITLPTSVDDSIAPPGKHLMSMFVQYAPYTLAEGPLYRRALPVRTERPRCDRAPAGAQPIGSGAHLRADRRQHHAGGDDAIAALHYAPGSRLGRPPHSAARPVPLWCRQPSRWRRHGCLRQERSRRDPARRVGSCLA